MLPPGLAGGPPGPPPGPGGPGGHPTPQVVNAILAQMNRPGGPPGPRPGIGAPPDAEDKPNGHGLSPLEGVQSVVQDLHDLMKLLPDPQSVNVAATCLKAMTGLQHQLMTQTQGGGP